jgi:hypothetical protein
MFKVGENVAAKRRQVIAQTRMPKSPIFQQAGPTAQKTHCVHYEGQPVNAVWENKRQACPCGPGRCEGNISTAPRILSSGGNLWCAVIFTPRSFTLREISCDKHWIGGWVGLRA